jgi:hypothetical protein
MDYLTITFDNDPKTIHLWRAWEVTEAEIKGNVLTLHWKKGDMVIESEDPKSTAKLIFSHGAQPEIRKGHSGIKSVLFRTKKKKKK